MSNKIDMVVNVDYWDILADTKDYNRICHGCHTEEQFYAFTEPIEDLGKDMKFLDFGCGPGRIVKIVSPNVCKYVGVDVSEKLLSMAREHHKRYENVSFHKCNGTDLKIFEDKTFDYIYERLVFIHVPKEWIAGYMREFSRILKNEGILNIPDFPKEDRNTNGFTLSQLNGLLKDFTDFNINDIGHCYEVRGIR